MSLLSTLLLPLRRALLERRERGLSLLYRASLEEVAYLEDLCTFEWDADLQADLIHERARAEALEGELVEVRVALAMLTPTGDSSASTDR